MLPAEETRLKKQPLEKGCLIIHTDYIEEKSRLQIGKAILSNRKIAVVFTSITYCFIITGSADETCCFSEDQH